MREGEWRRWRARTTPLGALAAGLVAGALGSWVQSLFFAATKRLAPRAPEGVFDPPEPEQRHETATQTVARRAVEKMLQRGPLANKRRAAALVHYGFGAAWGGLYGLLATSARPFAGPAGALGFGLGVWTVGDNITLPAFRLAAWPWSYPARTHAYAMAAHLAYGAALWGGFRALRRAATS